MTADQDTSFFGDFMPKLAVGAVVLLLAFLGYRAVFPKTEFKAEGRDANWDTQVRRSASEQKPAVILFTAGWCPACRALEGSALADSGVQAELRLRHTFVVVDVTSPTPESQQKSKEFGVSAIPTLIKFDADGHETARTHGMSADQLIAWLKDN